MVLWNQSILEEPSEKPVEKPPVMPPPVQSAPIPQPKPYIASARAETVFGSGVTIEGKIEGDSNVRIAGKFKGDIKIEADLNIEKGAHLGAKIHAAKFMVSAALYAKPTPAFFLEVQDGVRSGPRT